VELAPRHVNELVENLDTNYTAIGDEVSRYCAATILRRDGVNQNFGVEERLNVDSPRRDRI
jgi:hypothetical protein